MLLPRPPLYQSVAMLPPPSESFYCVSVSDYEPMTYLRLITVNGRLRGLE